MKATGLQNVNEIINNELQKLETGPADDDTTIDLALSTDVEKSRSDNEEDPDSALGSQVYSGSAPITTGSAPIVTGSAPIVTGNTPIFTGSVNPTLPEMSFQPLSMTETRSSSQWSQILDDSSKLSEISDPKIDENRKEIGNLENVGAKVAQYLEKLRSDDKFQISLASDVSTRKKVGEIGENETKLTFGTDLDASTLTEAKFVKGLQQSLDLSDDQD